MSIITDVATENRLGAAWAAANLHAESGMDANARHSVNLLLAQNSLAPLPAAQLARILAYGAWWQAVWEQYEAVKALISRGLDVRYDPAVPGPCPWTIWEIKTAGTPPELPVAPYQSA